MSSQICQNDSTQVEAAFSGQHVSVGVLHLPFSGLLFRSRHGALEDVGHFFHQLAVEKLKGAEHLLKMQNQHRGRVLFQNMQKPSQDAWGKTLEAMEAVLILEKNLNQALSDLCALSSAHGDHICDFLETHFLVEKVPIKKMDNHLTSLCKLACSQAGMEWFSNIFTQERSCLQKGP